MTRASLPRRRFYAPASPQTDDSPYMEKDWAHDPNVEGLLDWQETPDDERKRVWCELRTMGEYTVLR